MVPGLSTMSGASGRTIGGNLAETLVSLMILTCVSTTCCEAPNWADDPAAAGSNRAIP
jgi:hypothetical protein